MLRMAQNVRENLFEFEINTDRTSQNTSVEDAQPQGTSSEFCFWLRHILCNPTEHCPIAPLRYDKRGSFGLGVEKKVLRSPRDRSCSKSQWSPAQECPARCAPVAVRDPANFWSALRRNIEHCGPARPPAQSPALWTLDAGDGPA